LHLTHPGAWQAILAASAVVGPVLLAVGRLIGLATPAERAYAASVVSVGGAWLAARPSPT
jgi:hypothetical protein